jgi:hypothetical protein
MDREEGKEEALINTTATALLEINQVISLKLRFRAMTAFRDGRSLIFLRLLLLRSPLP